MGLLACSDFYSSSLHTFCNQILVRGDRKVLSIIQTHPTTTAPYAVIPCYAVAWYIELGVCDCVFEPSLGHAQDVITAFLEKGSDLVDIMPKTERFNLAYLYRFAYLYVGRCEYSD